mmetsp:Transcript_92687/g.294033  ORF Transcript_92687/g.294033 Transcript_92687/m.294033 type:complete len:291 (-) Transcript_92687:942-1814(-)
MGRPSVPTHLAGPDADVLNSARKALPLVQVVAADDKVLPPALPRCLAVRLLHQELPVPVDPHVPQVGDREKQGDLLPPLQPTGHYGRHPGASAIAHAEREVIAGLRAARRHRVLLVGTRAEVENVHPRPELLGADPGHEREAPSQLQLEALPGQVQGLGVGARQLDDGVCLVPRNQRNLLAAKRLQAGLAALGHEPAPPATDTVADPVLAAGDLRGHHAPALAALVAASAGRPRRPVAEDGDGLLPRPQLPPPARQTGPMKDLCLTPPRQARAAAAALWGPLGACPLLGR